MSHHLIGLKEALEWRSEKMRQQIRDWIQESISTKQVIYHSVTFAKQIEAAAEMILSALTNDKIIFSCGNGGSASDSAHFVGELLNRFTLKESTP